MPTTPLPDPDLPTCASRAPGRASGFVAVAVGFALAGIGVVAAAVVQLGDEPEAATVIVDDVVSTSPPSTVPAVDSVPRSDQEQRLRQVRSQPVTTPSTTLPVDDGLSPLAAQLGDTFSVIPEPVEARPRPIGLAIDTFDTTRFPVREVGLEDDGQLEVPDETEIGWYKYGATAGRPGATVLAAHVSWNNTTGPFFELGTVEPGEQIAVTLDDGSMRQYEVIERTMYDKSELPRDRIWRNTGDETLVLITCGGDFNPEIRRYRQNIVVYAVPVG